MRKIINADALKYLPKHKGQHGAIFTSLPDANEINLSVAAWETWFIKAAVITMQAVADDLPVIFCQTDRKQGRQLHSKANLLINVATANGLKLLWHKISMRRQIGAIDIYRPGYSHLLAFGKGKHIGPGSKPLPDVINGGLTVYDNGIGYNATLLGLRYIGNYTNKVTDPFCGRGTIPALADINGMQAIGVDIDPAQCRKARLLTLTLSLGDDWVLRQP